MPDYKALHRKRMFMYVHERILKYCNTRALSYLLTYLLHGAESFLRS